MTYQEPWWVPTSLFLPEPWERILILYGYCRLRATTYQELIQNRLEWNLVLGQNVKWWMLFPDDGWCWTAEKKPEPDQIVMVMNQDGEVCARTDLENEMCLWRELPKAPEVSA